MRKADERAVIEWLAGQYDGPERYRPNMHRARWGLQVQLKVRLDDKREGWVTRTQWFGSEHDRADAVVRLNAGIGLYGQQARAGRLRRAKLVTR